MLVTQYASNCVLFARRLLFFTIEDNAPSVLYVSREKSAITPAGAGSSLKNSTGLLGTDKVKHVLHGGP
jgi:hypothetical protein